MVHPELLVMTLLVFQCRVLVMQFLYPLGQTILVPYCRMVISVAGAEIMLGNLVMEHSQII